MPVSLHMKSGVTSHGGRATFYETLLEVSNILNSQRNTDDLWKAITGHIKQVIQWERAGICLYHADIDAFRFYAVETSMPVVHLKCEMEIPRAGSAMGWVYEHQQIHVRPNLQYEQLFVEDAYYCEEGLGRMINLPLLVKDQCLGSLNIGSVESGPPDPENVQFLSQVAKQIALAIDNVLAYEEITQLKEQLTRENAYLLEEIKTSHDFGAMVGNSQKFKKVLSLAQAVAPTNSTVLVTGETGTGKELLARLIHELSPRKNKPFVRVNCAALPSGLVESELFGHEKGAFTGAEQFRQGKFELADQGTLFLDEIGEMPIEAQAKLLRVLQDGIVERVGGIKWRDVDVRIIAATNTDLNTAILTGRFRSDLYYRLNVFPIDLPPLRERPQDIPLLVRHFMEKNRLQFKRPSQEIAPESLEKLVQYQWPGNIRELKNIMERAMILSDSSTLVIEETFITKSAPPSEVLPPTKLKDLERLRIEQALESCEWRIEGPLGAAKQLGLHPSTLRYRIKKLGLRALQDVS
ncbi:MAG: sigma 54-interacting transcriptional regulator [Nitrospirales bacterium]|nr:sigma 54-interacting transcriptional regulator [Nitrospirales bacterium]